MSEVQMTAYQIIDMVAVRHGFVAAAGSVAVTGIVAAAGVGRRAGSGVLTGDVESMLIDMVAMRVMQVSVVEIIRVAFMKNRPMAAAGGVPMGMLVMNRMVAHLMTPWLKMDEKRRIK
ncbi:MAG: hypothetical protein KF693_17540 [Nitrospira sp.]|nr:hypothetical protein [Nitrospira sp.]